MRTRLLGSVLSLAGLIVFAVLRPDAPTVGSDCEVLSTGWLREPVAAISALAIVGAGWIVSRHRPWVGTAVLLAGAASFAAHATAHPLARVIDGFAAACAVLAVGLEMLRRPPIRFRVIAALSMASVGVIVWALTRTGGPLCESVGSAGHAIWHLLVAAAVVVLFSPPSPGPASDD